jgi:outer membrane protein insertion porin family
LPDNLRDPDRGIEVMFAISEGPRSVVRTVTFEGNTVVPEADLQRLTVVSPGRGYVAGEMVADRDRIATEYRNRGYESVSVTSEPMFAESDTHVNVHYTINEGPLVRVDHIIITGNRRTSTRTIERELVLHEGDPLGEAALAESRARLYGLGLFRRASIEPVAHGGEPRRDLLVQVEEAPARVLGLGGGVEGGFVSRTGPNGLAEDVFEVTPRGFFLIGRRNLFGKNRTVYLYTRLSMR